MSSHRTAMVAKTEKPMLEGKQLIDNFLTTQVNITGESIYNTLHNTMHMDKVARRWVPRFLSLFHNEDHVKDRRCDAEADHCLAHSYLRFDPGRVGTFK